MTTALPPQEALALWVTLRRWPTFVEGFARVLRVGEGWPEEGTTLVWESRPGGRGRVTERVLAYDPLGRLETEVFETALSGVQTISFSPRQDEEDTSLVELQLDYTLTGRGPLAGRVADVLFIRRAITDSLRRTLRRFAVEAAEQATL